MLCLRRPIFSRNTSLQLVNAKESNAAVSKTWSTLRKLSLDHFQRTFVTGAKCHFCSTMKAHPIPRRGCHTAFRSALKISEMVPPFGCRQVSYLLLKEPRGCARL